jgi:uncharacterized protein with NRDE domain
MCLVFVWRAPAADDGEAWEHELAKRYRLVIASNRDEILSRPADRLGRWSGTKVIGGRDRSGGGTWLGMTDGGRWSCILNVREPEQAPQDAPSRGALCASFLLGESTPEDAARAAVRDGSRYAGFNAVFGAGGDAWHACNRGGGAVEMPRGVSVITNAAPGLDAPWPTAERGRRRFAEALRDAADDALVEALFAVLGDGTKLPLSPTRMPDSVEDRLCYICVPPVEVAPNRFWGTRTHTVFLVRADGGVTAVERSRLPGEADVREAFSIF